MNRSVFTLAHSLCAPGRDDRRLPHKDEFCRRAVSA